ncbi:MAG TPA: hypothetical protein VF160_11615 [Candidatus Dormibacteraeota bacterium]
MNRRAVLGVAGGGGGVALVAVAALLILLLLGKCSLPLSFGKSGAVVPPKPSASAASAATPTPNSSTSTPLAAASPTPSPSPTPSTPAQLIISSLPVHVGEVGVDYAPVTLAAAGGKPPYRWSTNPGALPAGLALNQDGVLSGRPTAAGDFTPTFRVDDSAGQAAGAAAPISIAPALTVTQPCVNGCSVEVGCTAACLAVGVQSGGVPPFQYAIRASVPPPGTSFANSLTLSGTVTPPTGKYSFTVSVDDSLDAPTRLATAQLVVHPHVALTQGSLTIFMVAGQGGSGGRVPFTPGDGTTAATLAGLPPGSTATVVQGNVVSIAVPGQAQPGTFSGSLTLTDQSMCGPASGEHCTAAIPVTVTVK